MSAWHVGPITFLLKDRFYYVNGDFHGSKTGINEYNQVKNVNYDCNVSFSFHLTLNHLFRSIKCTFYRIHRKNRLEDWWYWFPSFRGQTSKGILFFHYNRAHFLDFGSFFSYFGPKTRVLKDLSKSCPKIIL